MTTERDFDLPPCRNLHEPRTGRDALPWLAALTLALAVAALTGWWLYWQHVRSQKIARARQNIAQVAAQVAKHRAERAAAKTAAAAQLAAADERRAAAEQVVDDPQQRLLWASPTRGAPLSLTYAPNGALCLVYLRPAVLLAHVEGDKVMAALGPWGRAIADALESLSGVPLDEIDGVLASIVVRSDGELDACFRFDLFQPRSVYERERWDAGGESGRPFDLAGWPARARFLAQFDNDGKTRTLVVCPEEFYFPLAGSDGAQALVARDLEALVAQSDGDRVATVMVSPNFLAAGGAKLATADAMPLRSALDRLVGREATAVALSVHWDEDFFVELRAAPALSTPPQYLATVIRQRVEAAADQLAETIAAQSWSEYSRPVVERFPAMLRKLAEYARSGAADRQAVLRAYLPAVAGHNLLMGAELLLTQGGAATAGDAGHAPRGLARATQGNPQASVEERLAARASLVLPREPLERALELWGEAAGVATAIDGPAFEAAGVTRNQSLELDLRDRPAAEILLEILRRANPDQTAENAADLRQTLVYFIEPNRAGGPGRIIVTTRAAAAERGVALPGSFDGAGG